MRARARWAFSTQHAVSADLAVPRHAHERPGATEECVLGILKAHAEKLEERVVGEAGAGPGGQPALARRRSSAACAQFVEARREEWTDTHGDGQLGEGALNTAFASARTPGARAGSTLYVCTSGSAGGGGALSARNVWKRSLAMATMLSNSCREVRKSCGMSSRLRAPARMRPLVRRAPCAAPPHAALTILARR
jgi:hypothetical protein